MSETKYEVMGVYSHSTKYEYKLGERGSRYRHGTFWFVRKCHEDLYEVRPLNSNHIPSGVSKFISEEDFLKFYTPELDYYQDNTLPCLESLQKKVRLGRRYFNLGHLDRAEETFCGAVLMQDDNVDSYIGLSEIYAEQHRFSELRRVLDRLLNIDEMFREEQRHKFNEFGINLRKKNLFDDAIRFYSKALDLDDEDENLHFNIARALYAKGLIGETRRHLKRALELNPKMVEATRFLHVLEKSVAVPDEKALEKIEAQDAVQMKSDRSIQRARPTSEKKHKFEI